MTSNAARQYDYEDSSMSVDVSTIQAPRLIFANFVNELMTDVPGPAHVKALTAPSPRKIWIANEGDLIVTPRPMDRVLKEYACGILGIDHRKIATLSPNGNPASYLADRVAEDGTLLQIKQWAAENPSARFMAFALDRPTLELAEELRMPHAEYERDPATDVVRLIYDMNTKSGFRRVATELGLDVPPGRYCVGVESAGRAIRQFLSSADKVIVKFDRSSNGYGNWEVTAEDIKTRTAEDIIREKIAAWPEQPVRFTVEQYVSWTSAPSVELCVQSEGPRGLYICEQRCINNAWIGMISPPQTLHEPTLEKLRAVGQRFGQYVWERGFRGICDVDCLIAGETIYVTETNFRRTGGTYLDTLVRRLTGARWADTVWIADSRISTNTLSFENGLEAIEAAGLKFDTQASRGVVLTSNTREIDRKWRYLVIANDAQAVAEMERGLATILGIEL